MKWPFSKSSQPKQGRPMDTIIFSRNTLVTISPRTTHPVSDSLIEALSSFLGNYALVIRGFLVQFTYPPGYDPIIGDVPCLTCVLELDGDPDGHVFNEISRASQSIVD